MYSSGTSGSPSASSLYENSMIGRGSCIPSSSPRRFAIEPAAKLRTITSSGTISTWRMSCSRMFSRLRKCVGTPMLLSPVMKNSESRLFSTPLPSITARFSALKAVASSLKYCTSVPGSGPS